MHGSRFLSALLSTMLFGVLTLAPSGCSHEDGSFTSPGDGVPALGADGSAPAMPTGLAVVKATDQGFRLSWSPNVEADLAGYRVYVYDPSPYRDSAYNCANQTALIGAQQTWFIYNQDTSAGAHYFKLAAVDQTGNESERCGPYGFWYAPGSEDGTLDGRDADDADFTPPAGGWDDSASEGKEHDIHEGGGYN
jgi:hypothetical protein